eukprot:scaffold1378_cov257-Pinguiococcus_pyrenoidosus.AAC.17
MRNGVGKAATSSSRRARRRSLSLAGIGDRRCGDWRSISKWGSFCHRAFPGSPRQLLACSTGQQHHPGSQKPNFRGRPACCTAALPGRLVPSRLLEIRLGTIYLGSSARGAQCTDRARTVQPHFARVLFPSPAFGGLQAEREPGVHGPAGVPQQRAEVLRRVRLAVRREKKEGGVGGWLRRSMRHDGICWLWLLSLQLGSMGQLHGGSASAWDRRVGSRAVARLRLDFGPEIDSTEEAQDSIDIINATIQAAIPATSVASIDIAMKMRINVSAMVLQSTLSSSEERLRLRDAFNAVRCGDLSICTVNTSLADSNETSNSATVDARAWLVVREDSNLSAVVDFQLQRFSTLVTERLNGLFSLDTVSNSTRSTIGVVLVFVPEDTPEEDVEAIGDFFDESAIEAALLAFFGTPVDVTVIVAQPRAEPGDCGQDGPEEFTQTLSVADVVLIVVLVPAAVLLLAVGTIYGLYRDSMPYYRAAAERDSPATLLEIVIDTMTGAGRLLRLPENL